MSLFTPFHGAHSAGHDYYIYNVSNDSVIPSSGEPSTSVDFVGYLAVGSLPTVYALYCPIETRLNLRDHLCLVGYIRTPMLHASPFLNPRTDVPCYVLMHDFTSPPLNLPCLTVVSYESDMYSLYHYTNPLGGTIVHLARYPTGYHKITNEDLVAFSDIITASGQGTSNYPQSWICSESVNDTAAGSSNAIVLGQEVAKPKEPGDCTISMIMKGYQHWRYPLAYIRLLIRIVVLSGTTGNPHLIVLKDERDQRTEVINRLWPLSLIKANVNHSALETVHCQISKRIIPESEILQLASPWFSQFLYDVRRKLTNTLDDSRAGFGFGDGAYGDVLTDKIVDCIKMLIRPSAHMLPLSENGFYRFLALQICKEVAYHVLYRATDTCEVRLTIAEIEPATFRNAPYLPWDAMALFASSCYEVLMKRLSHYPNRRGLLATFPSASQVFAELKETGPMLLQQHDDPDIQTFRQTLRSLCLITQKDVYRISRPKKK